LNPGAHRHARPNTLAAVQKNRRNLIIMLAVLALLGAAALAEQVRQQRFGPRTFLSLDLKGLKRIERECSGCTKLVFQKRQGAWELVEPYVAQADEEQISRLIAIANAPVRHLLDETVVATDASGIAHPSAKLMLGERVLEFGTTTPAQDRYAKSGDRIALIQDRFTALLTSPPEHFVDRRPLLGRKAVGGRKVGGDFTPDELEAFSTLQATRVEPVPPTIGGHYITVRTDNGKETRFNYDFRGDGGVVLLRRGDRFVYVLERDVAGTIGMSAD
jgi:hypothetical protein